MTIEDIIGYIAEVKCLYKNEVKFFGYGIEWGDIVESYYNEGYFVSDANDSSHDIFFRNGEKCTITVWLDVTEKTIQDLRPIE